MSDGVVCRIHLQVRGLGQKIALNYNRRLENRKKIEIHWCMILNIFAVWSKIQEATKLSIQSQSESFTRCCFWKLSISSSIMKLACAHFVILTFNSKSNKNMIEIKYWWSGEACTFLPRVVSVVCCQMTKGAYLDVRVDKHSWCIVTEVLFLSQ